MTACVEACEHWTDYFYLCYCQQRVEYLPGVEVTCTPPELNVRLQDKNETHKFQWTFSLIFKVSEIQFLAKYQH